MSDPTFVRLTHYVVGSTAHGLAIDLVLYIVFDHGWSGMGAIDSMFVSIANQLGVEVTDEEVNEEHDGGAH